MGWGDYRGGGSYKMGNRKGWVVIYNSNYYEIGGGGGTCMRFAAMRWVVMLCEVMGFTTTI